MPIKKRMSVEQWIKNQEGKGARFFGILQDQEHLQEKIQRSEEEPVRGPGIILGDDVFRVEWFFKGYVYDVSDIKDRYNDEQIQLLILEHYDKERRKFERLSRLYKSEAIQRESQQRERIPEHVRIAVWRRDGGKCARCGSRELLCERCNREKRDRIE